MLLRKALPLELIERALTVINHGIGEGMSPEKMPIFRAQSYVPELQIHPAVTDLLHASPLLGLTESVFGVGGLEPVTKGRDHRALSRARGTRNTARARRRLSYRNQRRSAGNDSQLHRFIGGLPNPVRRPTLEILPSGQVRTRRSRRTFAISTWMP